MRTRKSWREKLENAKGKVVPMPNGTLFVPRGLDVDAAIRRVKTGQLVTQAQIRAHLALKAGADQACPITTGIFVRLSAEAAAEEELAGKQRITPFWRVIRDDGSLLEKLPGGAEGQAARLASEGQQLVRGKKIKVVEFKSCLARL